MKARRSVAVLLACLAGTVPGGATGADPVWPLVYLRKIDASIVQDIRYATGHNFTGRPVPGYEAAECLLLPQAARALSAVQNDLRSRGLGLKVFDCYRPRRAVLSFIDWAEGGGPSKSYYPALKRSQLIALGYIAARSNHSLGIAVDLTLIRLAASERAGPDSRLGQPCTESGPDGPGAIDMGTQFDCFDPKSATASRAATAAVRANRRILTEAMARQGFHNYAREWWHFTYSGTGADTFFDMPVVAPGHSN